MNSKIQKNQFEISIFEFDGSIPHDIKWVANSKSHKRDSKSFIGMTFELGIHFIWVSNSKPNSTQILTYSPHVYDASIHLK